MAFTRKALEAMGLQSAQIEQIMDLHVEVTDGLKAERDAARKEAAQVADLTSQIEALKAQAAGDYENKYKAEHEAFEAYKQQITKEAALTEKRKLYSDMLKRIGIAEERIGAIVKVTDLESIKVKDGALLASDELEAAAKNEWAAFIQAAGTQGAHVDTPPSGNSARDAFNAMTLSQKMAYANEHPAEAAEFMK